MFHLAASLSVVYLFPGFFVCTTVTRGKLTNREISSLRVQSDEAERDLLKSMDSHTCTLMHIRTVTEDREEKNRP